MLPSDLNFASTNRVVPALLISNCACKARAILAMPPSDRNFASTTPVVLAKLSPNCACKARAVLAMPPSELNFASTTHVVLAKLASNFLREPVEAHFPLVMLANEEATVLQPGPIGILH